jgi:hypothetical protein
MGTPGGTVSPLEPSPYESDGGNLIGRDPRSLSIAELGALGGPTSPIKAIRARCIDCCGGQPSEVRKCAAAKCPSWPFRMGVSPFHRSRLSGKNPVANFGPFHPASDGSD